MNPLRNAPRWLLPPLLILPLPVVGQGSGTLKGTVLGENATPVAQARIRIAGTDPTVVSGRDGRFQLAGVSPGRQVLEVRLLGYAAVLRPVEIAQDETVHVEVVLDPVPLPLKAVEVTGERALVPAIREFEERRAHGNGHFFNRQEIARMQPRVFTDVLRRIPGVQIQSLSTAFGPSDMVRMARTTGVTGLRPCPVLFYVNGTPFQVVGDISINQYVVPEEVVAIEVYAGMSEVPPQFQSNLLNARCGVIVIWTRSGDEEDRPPKRVRRP
jgi:carboxypeptidase family protein/TonB-dependent receptor-like protein